MELGDMVVVSKSGHPFYGLTGKIVGRRGNHTPGDPMMLVYIRSRSRSFLIPESMLQIKENIGEEEKRGWPF